MLDIAVSALADLLTLDRFVWLAGGVAIGLFTGLTPGLGGVAGMSLLLPFIYGMDPHSAMAILIGIIAANHTSDTFPAVLVGVPGSAGAGATVMDGYPLAKQGKAAKALGASFTASMLGGVFGALLLFLLLPVFRPLILAIGSPEMFMLSLLGISTVALLARGVVLNGLLAAAFGMLLSTVGAARAAPDYRYTFDWVFLADGLSLSLVAMAIFAMPEFIDLLARNKPVSVVTSELKGRRLEGAVDTIRHPLLVIRSSGLGALLGAIPGVGGSAISWIVYGLTARTAKNGEFGKGDIRGVIAPESANNAMEAGQLIPALMFGVPGSATAAVLLGGLILVGVQPGPELLSPRGMPLMLTIIWSLALANILATGACFLLRGWVSKLCLIEGRKLVPFLFVAVALAVYQESMHWADVAALLVIGTFAWFATKAGWPRSAMIVGFVLGPPAERYLWISMDRYGYEWLLRPGVLAIAALIAAILALGFIRRGEGHRRSTVESGPQEHAS